MVIIGVLSSWETFAIKLLLTDSRSATESAMWLKDRASWAISSSPSAWTLTVKSPVEKLFAAAAISRRGFVILLVTK